MSAANKAAWRLTLDDGTDLNPKINPRLIDWALSEKRGESSDELSITLDNSDGKLSPPQVKAILRFAFGWASGSDVKTGLVDKGRFTVDEVERGGPPDRVTIKARATDFTGSYKKRKDRSFKDQTLAAIIGQIAADQGYNSRIHPTLASIIVKVIEQAGKSDMQFLRDLGRRYDALASVKDKTIIFMPIGSPTNAGGASIPPLSLTKRDGWTWSFRHAARTDHDGAEAQYHDRDAAKRQTVKTGGTNPKRLKKTYANEGDAKAAAKASTQKQGRGAWEFDYDLALGNPDIIPNAKVNLSGWDSEIDGKQWLVAEVEHRGGAGGFNTRVKLESA